VGNLQTALYPILLHLQGVIELHAQAPYTIQNMRHHEQLEACQRHLREAQLDLVGLPDAIVVYNPPMPSEKR